MLAFALSAAFLGGLAGAQEARVLRDLAVDTSFIALGNIHQFDLLGERLVVLGGERSAHGIWSFALDGTDGALLVAVPEELAVRNPVAVAGNGEILIAIEGAWVTSERIWATDGTAEGTRVLREPGESPQSWGTAFSTGRETSPGGKIVFAGSDPEGGLQLWSTEGFRESTVQLSYSERLARTLAAPAVAVGGELALVRELWATGAGCEIWFTDGTPAGTREVALVEGLYLRPSLARAGNRLFAAFDSPYGAYRKLYVSDGTGQGTHQIELPVPGWQPHELVTRGRGEVAYFRASSSPGGEEIWRSDGTATGTVRLTDFPWWSPFDDWRRGVLALDEGVLARARSDIAGDIRYWFARADGTSVAPVLDLEPPGSGLHDAESDALFSVESGRAVFLASSPATGTELWSSDGSDAGTFPLTQAGVGPASGRFRWVRESAGRVLFVVDPSDSGPELWSVNEEGTAAAPIAIFAEGSYLFGGSSGPPAVLHSGSVWLLATQLDDQEQLFESPLDGSGPLRRTRLGPKTSSSWPLHFDGSGRLFAFDTCVLNRIRAWSSDGTSLGTGLLPIGYSQCSVFETRPEYWREAWKGRDLVLNWPALGAEQIFYVGADGTTRRTTEFESGRIARGLRVGEDLVYPREIGFDVELWLSSPTAGAPSLVAAVDEPAGARYTSGITALGEGGIFMVSNVFLESEVWWTDGTSDGTRSLKTRAAGLSHAWTGWKPVGIAKDAYFPAWNGTEVALYRYRHSSGEIERLTPPGTSVDRRAYLPIRFREGVAVLATDEIGWRIGFYSPLTRSLRWIPLPGSRGTSEPGQGWAANEEVVLFSWRTEELGTEPWASNLTADGTGPLLDIEPGPFSSSPAELTPTAKGIYFSAFDHLSGRELWRTDGMPGGTVRAGDLARGGESSSPAGLVALGSHLAFSAFRADIGREPWTLDLELSPDEIFLDDFECGGPWNWDSRQ